MQRFLREPLVHFLLLGAAVLALSALVGARSGPEPDEIVVTRGRIEHLAAGFERVHGRPPRTDELEGLIRDHVREKVYCREAQALGLDRDDAVIRNRLRLKMEFLAEDVGARAEPTDEQLQEVLEKHAGAFRIEPRFTFRHVYLDPERRRGALQRDAADLLAQLNRSGERADATALGDPFLLDHGFEAVPESEVGRLFGERFAAELGELTPGRWHGPVESGYGLHLVLVTARTEGRVPALEEVRDAVSREWSNAQRQKASEQFYADLLERYTVIVEQPEATSGEEELAAVPP
jgi:hypothetical protein